MPFLPHKPTLMFQKILFAGKFLDLRLGASSGRLSRVANRKKQGVLGTRYAFVTETTMFLTETPFFKKVEKEKR